MYDSRRLRVHESSRKLILVRVPAASEELMLDNVYFFTNSSLQKLFYFVVTRDPF
jgi:hypothetical protein